LKREVLLGSATVILCGILFYETTLIADYGFAQVGADVWPRIVLGVISVLAFLQIVQGFYQSRTTVAPATDPQHDGCGLLSGFYVPITVFTGVVLFALLVPFIGFILSGLLMVFGLLSLIGPKSPRSVLIHAGISLSSVLCVTVFFTQVMGVYLPGWAL
jgi:hypothetical protein